MSVAEPTPALLENPFKRYVLATRPAFLTITLVAVLLGLAVAYASGVVWRGGLALVAVVLALLTHAAVNLLNDYYDALNGTDAGNAERVFPFTGGSRFIQNGVLSLQQVGVFGGLLVLLVIAGGLWLLGQVGFDLFWIGLAGVLLGWAYSAPPLKLNSRGWGELTVAVCFVLLVLGADYVQRGQFDWLPVWASGSYALLVTLILYINQFPDYAADKQAGKHHWVVRLGQVKAAGWYGVVVALSVLWLLLMLLWHKLNGWAALALLSLPLSLLAARTLRVHAEEPAALLPAIKQTILAAHVHGILLATGLLLGKV